MNDNHWVDQRLAALDDVNDWQPDASRARARLRDFDRRTKARRRWAWVTAAAACLGLLVFLQPHACATPRGCVQEALAADSGTQSARNYKESGSPAAPVAVEVYSDYQCPDCTAFFRDIMPQLIAEYVQTGKVKLVHRDFPLPQHKYAQLAARYANAAGQAGAYDMAISRLFETQGIWRLNGDIDAQLASVLSPEVMAKVRDTVAHDAKLDDTVAADQAIAAGDAIHHTPSVVIVWQGKRTLVEPISSYSILKSRLEEILSQH